MNMLKPGLAMLALLTSTLPAIPQIRGIDRAKLPQDPLVQRAYQDVSEVEPYVLGWANDWRYPVPKSQVTSRLQSDLSQLQAAASTNRDNAELWLLLGLTAHYGYNVDIEGT